MFKKLFKKSKTILVIEDDDSVAHTIEIALNAKGYKILRTSKGHEGIRMAMTHVPQAIILDIRLPDIDGWQVLNNLKATDKAKNIPVLVLTQLNQLGDINTGFGLGAASYVTKPLDLNKLYAKLAEILDE
ncbi:MAG: response regulator [Elusimicrobia bacterium]|nr:response regulator [Elusimicrobiota bacterium]